MTISSAAISSCQSCISNFCDGKGIFKEYGIKSVTSYEWPKKGLSLDLLVKQLDQNYQLSGRNNYEKNVELKLLLSSCQKHSYLQNPYVKIAKFKLQLKYNVVKDKHTFRLISHKDREDGKVYRILVDHFFLIMIQKFII